MYITIATPYCWYRQLETTENAQDKATSCTVAVYFPPPLVLTTHYILDTLQPQWERGVELFVADFTEVVSCRLQGYTVGERGGALCC